MEKKSSNSDSHSFYITTPIFYPNARLHLGHAYTTTVCDILARYHRLKGDKTYFLTGSDENTEKVVRAATVAGKSTKDYLDEIVGNFKDLFSKLGISYDQFIRTTDEINHYSGAIELWNRINKSGDLEKRSYKGLYCVGHESFITEKDLVDGKCPDHNELPQVLEETNWFFKLSKYTEAIKEKISSNEFKIVPDSRRNEILALLDRGLEDISFSRPANTVSIGIPVPNALFVHGFITSGGKKMSKSLGNVIDPLQLIEEYGAEAVRYYLARHISPFEDGDITLESFREAYNAHLANGLGNLVSRVMKMAEAHLEAPAVIPEWEDMTEYFSYLEKFEINKAVDCIWAAITEIDKRIQEDQPFKLVKADKDRGQKIISELVVKLYSVARMLNPILPDTSVKMKKYIKENKTPSTPLFPRKE